MNEGLTLDFVTIQRVKEKLHVDDDTAGEFALATAEMIHSLNDDYDAVLSLLDAQKLIVRDLRRRSLKTKNTKRIVRSKQKK